MQFSEYIAVFLALIYKMRHTLPAFLAFNKVLHSFTTQKSTLWGACDRADSHKAVSRGSPL
jgi:hypothetical protein